MKESGELHSLLFTSLCCSFFARVHLSMFASNFFIASYVPSGDKVEETEVHARAVKSMQPEADPEGGEGGSSPGQIFRIKDVNFFDSFLQVFCRLQSTGRCSLITNHKAFRANIKRHTCSKLT